MGFTHLLLLEEIVSVQALLPKFPVPSFLVHLRPSFEGDSFVKQGVDNALLLPAVLPSTPLLLGTSDIAAGIALHLPTVLPPTPPLPGTSDMATDTALRLPVALPSYSSSSRNIRHSCRHCRVGDVSTNSTFMGHSSEKSLSWHDWENSFIAFKAFFDSGIKILRSIDELLPLCYQFDGYAMFQSAFVYPETIGVLRKFMDKNGGFMDITGVTSSFSRSTAFRALGLVLHGMDTM
ncbi:hypothetical protein Pyn_01569 [Prunus yedoensis var. nudiflora]|uniref:Uncharacterized protein n=1 Tax=Prunus yedoensis var. nudiflora TaxID=2094558 RepID=A0A314YCX5_PRUYE|nr:hypothetical protein Pyn_01569 [Prunus yedoensis var. nudiflora]